MLYSSSSSPRAQSCIVLTGSGLWCQIVKQRLKQCIIVQSNWSKEAVLVYLVTISRFVMVATQSTWQRIAWLSNLDLSQCLGVFGFLLELASLDQIFWLKQRPMKCIPFWCFEASLFGMWLLCPRAGRLRTRFLSHLKPQMNRFDSHWALPPYCPVTFVYYLSCSCCQCATLTSCPRMGTLLPSRPLSHCITSFLKTFAFKICKWGSLISSIC